LDELARDLIRSATAMMSHLVFKDPELLWTATDALRQSCSVSGKAISHHPAGVHTLLTPFPPTPHRESMITQPTLLL
jgi:hypothetical protein